MVEKEKLSLLEFCMICIGTLYFIVPIAQKMIPFYFALSFEFFYLALCIKKNAYYTGELLKSILLIAFIAALYALLTSTNSISDVSNIKIKRFVSKFFQYSSLFFPLLFTYRCSIQGTYRQRVIIMVLAVAAMIFASKTVLDMIAINPLAARDFGVEANEINTNSKFVAPYPFVYGMTFSFIVFLLMAIKTTSKMLKPITLILSCFIFYFLIKAQYALSIVTTLVTLTYMYSRKMKSSASRTIFLVLTIIGILLLPSILSLIIPFMPESLAIRFQEISDFFLGKAGESGESDMLGRFNLYGKAILAFLSSPILGNSSLPFDGHSTFFMIFADIGLFGGLALFSLLKKSNRLVCDVLGNKNWYFTPFYFHFLLNGFTNPIHSSLQIPFCLWFFVPLCIDTFSDTFK